MKRSKYERKCNKEPSYTKAHQPLKFGSLQFVRHCMPRRHASTREVVKHAQLASHGKSGNPYARHPLAFKTPVLRHLDAKMGFRQRSRLCFQPRPQRDKTVTFKPSFRPEFKEQVSETRPGSKDQETRATYLEIIQRPGFSFALRLLLGVKRCELLRLNLALSSSVR